VVSWSGPGDLAELTRAFGCGNQMCADDPNPQWVGRAAQAFHVYCLADVRMGNTGWNHCTDNRYAQTAPVTYLDAGDPPTLLAAATEDPLIPFSQHKALADAASAVGVEVHEVVIPGGRHARAMRESSLDQPGLWAAETVPFLDDCLKFPPCHPSGIATAVTTSTAANEL
jgi:acetyl esterase/lipase